MARRKNSKALFPGTYFIVELSPDCVMHLDGEGSCWAIVEVDASGRARIEDSNYRSYEEAKRYWPEADKPVANP